MIHHLIPCISDSKRKAEIIIALQNPFFNIKQINIILIKRILKEFLIILWLLYLRLLWRNIFSTAKEKNFQIINLNSKRRNSFHNKRLFLLKSRPWVSRNVKFINRRSKPSIFINSSKNINCRRSLIKRILIQMFY